MPDAQSAGLSAAAIPILLYHSIGEGTTPRFRWQVSARTLERHLAMLADAGREVMTISELAGALSGCRPLPARPAAITFDDGYGDFHRVALPRLEAAGVRSTLYLTVGYLGASRDGIRMLDPQEAHDASARGTEIGAHTLTHPQLDVLTPGRAREEIAGSRAALQNLLDLPVATFAYPHGYNSATTRRLVQDSGYSSAVAVKNALSHFHDDVFALARLNVTQDMSLPDLRRALEADGGWPLAQPGDRSRTRAWRGARRVLARARGRGSRHQGGHV